MTTRRSRVLARGARFMPFLVRRAMGRELDVALEGPARAAE